VDDCPGREPPRAARRSDGFPLDWPRAAERQRDLPWQAVGVAWIEVGDRVWYRRYPAWDVNVGVIAGAGGLLLVDTLSSPREARTLRADLAELPGGADAVRWVMNTHAHFDHWFGNAVFAGARIVAQAQMPRDAAGTLAEQKEFLAARSEPYRSDMASLELAWPDELVAESAAADLGDRQVHFSYLGRGHTRHDLVASVATGTDREPAQAVLFAGDLIESSAPPAFGPDSFPLDWPRAARALSGLAEGAVVVPGHGPHVDAAFVASQGEELGQVASQIHRLHAAGVPETDALAAGSWPWDACLLDDAVRRGYAQLSC